MSVFPANHVKPVSIDAVISTGGLACSVDMPGVLLDGLGDDTDKLLAWEDPDLVAALNSGIDTPLRKHAAHALSQVDCRICCQGVLSGSAMMTS